MRLGEREIGHSTAQNEKREGKEVVSMLGHFPVSP